MQRNSGSRWRDGAIALSLANLWFLTAWARLESEYLYYFRKAPLAGPAVSTPLFAAAIANILLLAMVFWAAMRLARRSNNRLALGAAQLAFLLSLAVPLNILRTQYNLFSFESLLARTGKTGFLILALAAAAAAGLVLFRWFGTAVRGAAAVVLILLPLFPLAIVQTAWIAYRYPPPAAFADKPSAPPLPARPDAPRVLWLVFDELDQRLAFLQRPPNVHLPHLDRLRAESLFAHGASRPGSNTLMGIPAMVTGRPISKAEVVRLDELRLTFTDNRTAGGWSRQPNLFSQARAAGFNTAVVGWYHPYCRVLSSSLTSCYWEPASSQFHAEEHFRSLSFPDAMLGLWREQLVKVPLAVYLGLVDAPVPELEPYFRQAGREMQIGEYRRIHERALAAAADPALGLALLHWPVPHPLGIYSRERRELTAADGVNYLDNLALVDRTVGELREALERAGLWDRTILLLTSDHPLRTHIAVQLPTWTEEESRATGDRDSPLVPFVLKLAGQNSGLAYEAPFSSLLAHDLMLALLRGEVATAEQAAAWLDQHRQRSPEPAASASSQPANQSRRMFRSFGEQ
jgi:hypothetical protein